MDMESIDFTSNPKNLCDFLPEWAPIIMVMKRSLIVLKFKPLKLAETLVWCTRLGNPH